MKLSRALLCMDCDEIHDTDKRCPSCGSQAAPLVLSRVLAPRPDPLAQFSTFSAFYEPSSDKPAPPAEATP